MSEKKRYQHQNYPKFLFARDPQTGAVVSEVVRGPREHDAYTERGYVESPEELPPAPAGETAGAAGAVGAGQSSDLDGVLLKQQEQIRKLQAEKADLTDKLNGSTEGIDVLSERVAQLEQFIVEKGLEIPEVGVPSEQDEQAAREAQAKLDAAAAKPKAKSKK